MLRPKMRWPWRIDIFALEWASDPQIAPDGETIVYVRNFMDIAEVAHILRWFEIYDETESSDSTTTP